MLDFTGILATPNASGFLLLLIGVRPERADGMVVFVLRRRRTTKLTGCTG